MRTKSLSRGELSVFAHPQASHECRMAVRPRLFPEAAHCAISLAAIASGPRSMPMSAEHASSDCLAPASGRAFSSWRSLLPLLVGLRLQHHSDRRGAGQGGLERGAQPVPAPRRPHSQPRRDGEGLRRAREGCAGGRGRGARQGDAGDAAARGADRSRGVQGVPGQPVRPDRRAVAAARGGRELSRPQGQPEFPGAAGAARRHRKPHRRGAARLHRGRPGLQHDAAGPSRRSSGRRSGSPTTSRSRISPSTEDKMQPPKVDFN